MATRKLPEEHEDIVAFGKGRNPMNHPVVMFRKGKVEEAGSYRHFMLFEDYYLWVRMLMRGCRMHNLQESLLLFRQCEDMYRRRGGWGYAVDEVRFQREIARIGFISRGTAMKNIALRFGVRMMPNGLRHWVYSHLLRR